MRYLLIIGALLLGSLILGYVFFTHQTTKSTPSMPVAKAFIELNMSPEKFVEINWVDQKRGINSQPAGLDFYSVRWPIASLGQVFLENGPYSFTFPNTLRVTGTYDRDLPRKGIYVFRVSGGMSTQSDIYHDEARLRFLEFLAMLRQRGWQTFINLEDPRLPTNQALHYALQEDNVLYSLPIDADIDLDTWMRITDNDWRMYAGDVIMKIDFLRDTSRLDLDKPSDYLFSYEVYNMQELIINQLENDEQKNAAQIWPQRKLELQERRHQKELLLEQQGYHIDRSYVDPELVLE